jgi:hypothetical protein
MRRLHLLAFLCLLAVIGHAQSIPADATPKIERPRTHKDTAVERKLNIYANRKYSYGVSECLFGFHPNSTIFHATDVIVSDRLKVLNSVNLLSFELTGGASFQPYQGFRIHVGFDLEVLTPTKVHLYFGAQYALGLKQRTIEPDHSWVVVGYHSYAIPFIGIMYWPGKRDIKKLDKSDPTEKSKYYNPTFWQLVYFKCQIGCSSLCSRLKVDTSATFDGITASNIRQNVSSGLYLSLGVGINIPTFSDSKLNDRRQLHYLKVD